MDERDRIEKMVEDGKITGEEAQKLLAVLSEIDDASASLEHTIGSVDLEAEAVGRTGVPVEGSSADAPQPSHPPAPDAKDASMHGAHASVDGPHETTGDGHASDGHAEPEWADDFRQAVDAAGRAAGQAMTDVSRAVGEVGRAVFGDTGQAAGTEATADASAAATVVATSAFDCAPAGTKWLRVSLVASILTVRVDASVAEPVLSGDTKRVKLESTPYGFLVTRSDEADRGEWSIPFLTHFPKTELDIRIPTDMGIETRMTAGELSLVGVAYLRGKLTAGDVNARNLRGIDFTTAAGNVDIEVGS